jgi:hypothetical protein
VFSVNRPPSSQGGGQVFGQIFAAVFLPVQHVRKRGQDDGAEFISTQGTSRAYMKNLVGKIRNDRLVAVAVANHMYANVKKLKDLPSKWIKELQVFFVNYHYLEGKEYRLLGCKGADAAMKLIKQAKKERL